MSCWPLAVYQFRVQMDSDLSLPRFASSLLRSVFGSTLKRLVCSGHGLDKPCPEQCAYRLLFAPVNQPGARFTDAAPPLIFRFPLIDKIPQQDYLEFSMVLFGPALDYLPLITDVWRRVFEQGIGHSRKTGRLNSVAIQLYDGSWKTIYDSTAGLFLPHQPELVLADADDSAGDKLKLRLETPMRLMSAGKLLPRETLTADALAKALLRRIHQANQSYLHQSVPDWLQFQNWFASVNLKAVLQPVALSRYSSRQKQSMRLTGYLGEIHLQGVPRELYSWLVLGQYLHLGKNSVMGLGQYCLNSSSDSRDIE
ncbi:CRISPR system precrRNA processing endoribonuclease RAMP protein Cas6 [Endozoicomonas sp. ONNA2]|uniref:CRISPR system precrRNA processing endoribonuclease RAMP protein Cas6 n=1 Tax=Endozoicomonas sp. ONNA2 TaxID=2828741 RepID=UPI0021496FE7|nr:CRISPR system precrRNA processing endoribonuclease RAMP protein Cas6 [Endozoicomonas sp. ONNA2]